MPLFDLVNEQTEAVRLPLHAVTLTAAARVNTPLIAILHWHGFQRETPLALPRVELPRRPVPADPPHPDALKHFVTHALSSAP